MAAKKPTAKKPSARAQGKTVGGYLDAIKPPLRELAAAVHAIARAAAPDSAHSIKWGQPVYEDQGPFAFLKASKAHLTFGFWRGYDLFKSKPLWAARLEGTGIRMRHWKLRSAADLDAKLLAAMIREAVRLNRAKGDPTRR